MLALRAVWYPEGKKRIPLDVTLSPLALAIWYFDDGSNSADHRNAVLCTQSFTTEEADFLKGKLAGFDLRPTTVKVVSQYTGREMPVLKFSKASYDNLIHLVKPFMLWPCFDHKIAWRPAKKQWESSGKFTEDQAKQMLELRKTMTAKEIAPLFKVHVNTIYALVSGRSWPHLPR